MESPSKAGAADVFLEIITQLFLGSDGIVPDSPTPNNERPYFLMSILEKLTGISHVLGLPLFLLLILLKFSGIFYSQLIHQFSNSIFMSSLFNKLST